LNNLTDNRPELPGESANVEAIQYQNWPKTHYMEAIMEKLSMQDATFLYSETDKVSNHIASLQQYELPKGVSPQTFVASLRVYLNDRIHLLPLLTRKVKMMPGGIDHAVWIQDGQFDINNHIVEIAIESPGTFEQVQAKVAELHAKPMDRSRPLWRFYVITGLADGNVAYYAQVHHACVDGMAGQLFTILLTDPTAEPQAKNCPADFLKDEKPGIGELLLSSFQNLAEYQRGSIDRSIGMLKTASSLGQRAIDPSKSFGAAGQSVAKTRFNHPVEEARAFACGKIPLSDVRKIGKAMGASVNDVFLSVCSGALRRYLTRHGELPRRNLVAGCPVALPKQGRADQGNSVSMMAVDLFTNIEDPRTRLLRVKASSKIAKELTAELAGSVETNMSLFGLPAMTQAASWMNEFTGAAETMPMPFNVLISNVPGPREPIYSNGAKMLSHYPVSIPAHGLGLNITVQSYCDGLFVGLTACKKAVPDVAALKDDLIAAFVELRSLTLPANILEMGNPQPAEKPAEAVKTDDSEEKMHKVA
jgi:diacylglycerol O-acyltransferase